MEKILNELKCYLSTASKEQLEADFEEISRDIPSGPFVDEYLTQIETFINDK